ncbi:MAG TPA: hypothetical protein VHE34_14085 [Puia sp.]|uniref:hypothetical protein n=1 Tax=Puia sp. TaxID=2045100 RepID=UPI002BD36F9F|nr:hypothetical protein [Puia sp.]HVU96353.1 hypothetical protein [Puia sp.]
MKSTLRRSFVLVSCLLAACGKSSHGPTVPATPATTISVIAGDSALHYTVNLVYIQDVNSIHTTLISGEYPDTSGKKGSLAIRLPGDTTGRWTGASLHITYTDGKGNVYYNTDDTTNYVQLDKYPKTYNGVVSGQFSFMATGGAGSLTFSNGSIIALYQK